LEIRCDLEELSQLHERQALLPRKEEDMSHEQANKALRYSMLWEENLTKASRPEDL